ncbi:MATE family efflux transporter [Floccifex sp.]|uniref:MATE family efflux transporter n=1 Tax=Floccifex sp. TaxID=2815810 RepID=UPI002A758101|nr:MATE family efflux transporter [Floccifex sp.]MDD7280553.1 MATE family efflux transporter [Erysipelotrichaceae bacterium]MDY2958277.1 MATE family efflux transporter [Floccifex sp.]
MRNSLLLDLIEGRPLSLKNRILLITQLSLPSICAQISTTAMQYIDTAMVGHLGANESASIGLVSSTIWLLTGLSSSFNAGFTVQMAQSIGANEKSKTRNIMKQGFIACLILSFVLCFFGIVLSPYIPIWLKGDAEIVSQATNYLRVYSFFIPFHCLNAMASVSLQASGNMKIPSVFNVLMCVLDVVLNYFFIFPIGLNLGVTGAALATGTSIVFSMICQMYYIFKKSELLKGKEPIHLEPMILKNTLKIGVPVTVESTITSMSYILFTRIVAPLGTVAVAAHSFAVTAESLCYMPGYGIGQAATTIIGQSIGAKRRKTTKSLSYLITSLAAIVMACSGIFMFYFAPEMIGFMTKDIEIQTLAINVLRIEAFAEPLYGISIVCAGVFRGAGDTFISSILNFISMWCVRLPLAYFLSLHFGLYGIWMAMCLELCFRGIIFLIRLMQGKWIHEF